MRSLGAATIPSWIAFEQYDSMSQRCRDYAQARIAERLTTGQISSLDQVQADEDACRESLGFKRNLLQFAVLSIGLGAAAYVGMRVWKG